jgi:hypothetical protein
MRMRAWCWTGGRRACRMSFSPSLLSHLFMREELASVSVRHVLESGCCPWCTIVGACGLSRAALCPLL